MIPDDLVQFHLTEAHLNGLIQHLRVQSSFTLQQYSISVYHQWNQTDWCASDLVRWHQQGGCYTNAQCLKCVIRRREERVPRFSCGSDVSLSLSLSRLSWTLRSGPASLELFSNYPKFTVTMTENGDKPGMVVTASLLCQVFGFKIPTW